MSTNPIATVVAVDRYTCPDACANSGTLGTLEIPLELQEKVANAILANVLRTNDVTLRIRAENEPVDGPPTTRHKVNGRSPGVVGLLAFGMTTVLLNLHNSGIHDLGTSVPAMGICFGGSVQIIAGLLEYFNNNNFGFIAFTSYGAFWLSLVCIWMLPTKDTAVVAASAHSVASYLLFWGIFTAVMFPCTLRKNGVLAFVFASLTVLFLLLAIADYSGNETVKKIAGIEGILCGASALYLSFAEILENQLGHWVLPVFPLSK